MVNEQAEALKAEGNKLVGKKEYAEAAKKYKKAVKIDPTCAPYWSNLAMCYEKMLDYSAFKEAARRAFEAEKPIFPSSSKKARATYSS